MRHSMFVLMLTFFSACALASSRSFDIPAQDLTVALEAFAKQADTEVLFDRGQTQGKQSTPVKGELDPVIALKALMGGSGLPIRQINDRTFVVGDVRAVRESLKLSQASLRNATLLTAATSPQATESREREAVEEPADARGVSEILVRGSSILNVDIRRTRDDAQPYMIFDREQLQQSGAPNLEEFFKTRLTSNVTAHTSSSSSTGRGLSMINLRGFGIAQTLILIDGRRVPTPVVQGLPLQPDINMIPVSAIERVEVLSTTSSGIYGGSATGGVINIILRRDFTGVETKLTYDNSFDSDSSLKRVDFGSGLALEGGRTTVLFGGSYTDVNPLEQGDRDLYARGIARIGTNNRAQLYSGSSPPVGATPNIRSTTGANLVLKNGNVPLNSPYTYVPVGYTGIASDNGAALRLNAGNYNFNLANTPQSAASTGYTIAAAARTESLMAMVRRQFTPSLQAYVDVMASNTRDARNSADSPVFSLPASAPNNPFLQAISVRVPMGDVTREYGYYSQNRKLAVGAILKLPAQWMTTLDATFGRTSMIYRGPLSLLPSVSPIVSTGTPDILRDPAVTPYGFTAQQFQESSFLYPSKSKLLDTSWRLSGPLFALPAGEVMLSSLLEYREDQFADVIYNLAGTQYYYPTRDQSISSGYAELFVPIVSAAQSVPLVHDLGVQLAVRHDRNVVGGGNSALAAGVPIQRTTNRTSSTNPTVALRYQPVKDVIVRASYGTGFLAPSVFQLGPLTNLQTTGPVDPRRGNVAGPAYISIGGGNPNLKPEESETWSAGVVVNPSFLPGLRLSADYTHIEKKDNIATLSAATILLYEDLFPGRVIRGPLQPGDPYAYGPITQLDATSMNVSRARLNAWDLSAEYTFNTATAGTFVVSSMVTLTDRYDTQVLAALPWQNAVGVANIFNSVTTPGITLKYRGNINLRWSRGAWKAGWFTSYFDSYYPWDPTTGTNTALLLAQGGNQKVPSQMFHDISFGYDFGAGLLEGIAINGGVRNVFNTKPEFDTGNSLTYSSPFGDPRLSSYYLSLSKKF